MKWTYGKDSRSEARKLNPLSLQLLEKFSTLICSYASPVSFVQYLAFTSAPMVSRFWNINHLDLEQDHMLPSEYNCYAALLGLRSF